MVAGAGQFFLIMSPPIFIWGRHIVFVRVVCCLVSVCLSVTLLVRTITPDLLLLLKWNFIYGKIMRRGSAVHKVHNSSISIFWVIALCWYFFSDFVRTITFDVLMLLKWNFIYGKIMRRGSAVHKVHNSSISIFWVIAPCWFLHYWPLLIFSFTLCPDDNFLSTTDIEMKPHIWKEHEARKCSAQEPQLLLN